MNQIMLERRQFLQAGSVLVVGFALAPVAPALAQQDELAKLLQTAPRRGQ